MDMVEHQRVEARMRRDIPTCFDGIPLNIKMSGHKINDAFSGTIVFIEDDSAFFSYFMLLFLVEVEQAIQQSIVRALAAPNRKELWRHLHVIPSKHNPCGASGKTEGHYSSTLEHL